MARVCRIFVVLLLGTVAFAAMPAADDLETTFNETGTAASLGLPPALSVKLIPPAAHSTVLSKVTPWWPSMEVNSAGLRRAPALKPSSAHSLQTLLCTFLI